MINRQTLLMGKANFVEFKNIQRVNSITLSAFFLCFSLNFLILYQFPAENFISLLSFLKKKIEIGLGRIHREGSEDG